MSPADRRHVVLVGLMATGKSTVGRLLADRLGRRLLDSDAQVEARTGRTVREIWRTEGEPAFRTFEAEALADALDDDAPTVIAAAGGVVLAEANRLRLAADDVTVVWLRASPATLLDRVRAADDEHRPLLDTDPAGMLERMATARTPLYDEVADITVDVDALAPDQVVEEIVAALEARGARP